MSSNNITIGIDLGDRRHAVCVLSAGGEILAEDMITNTRECLIAFAQRHPGAVLVMETGTHSPWVSRLLPIIVPEIEAAGGGSRAGVALKTCKPKAYGLTHKAAWRSGSSAERRPRLVCGGGARQ